MTSKMMAQSRYNRSVETFLSSPISDSMKRTIVDIIGLVTRCRDDVPFFSEQMLGMKLNPFQRTFIERSCTPRRLWKEKFGDTHDQIGGLVFGKNIAYPGNQAGKTVMLAIKHIHRNYFKTGLDLDDDLIQSAYYATLNLSPHSRQVRQCYTYVKDILTEKFLILEDGKTRTNRLHPLLRDFLAGENVNLGEMRFRNKSVFYTVPTGHDEGSSLAGGQFGYISYDEASQSRHLQSELGAKIMSRLIKYGTGMDIASTAEVDSDSQQYYMKIVKQGLRGEDGWWSLCGSLEQNTFIPADQREMIKKELLATDRAKYRQVVHGDFIAGGKRLFDPHEIEKMFRLSGRTSAIPGHKYLMVSDWGMADTGDFSVHYMFDYTDWFNGGKIRVVAYDEMQGGSPHMQFALARALYDSYTLVPEGEEYGIPPVFLMDSQAMGGVTIKKLLRSMKPLGFDIEKDEGLLLLKKVMSEGRDYYESDIDASLVERNPDYGKIQSFYIEKLSEQLAVYHIEDQKLTQDHVMCLMMGIAWIASKVKRRGKPVMMNPLASHNANVVAPRRGQAVSVKQISVAEMLSR